MAYTKTGPFTNGAAPGIAAPFLNEVERALIDDVAHKDVAVSFAGIVTAPAVIVTGTYTADTLYADLPDGISVATWTSGSAGWPHAHAVVVTVKVSTIRTWQMAVTTNGHALRRFYHATIHSGWSAWRGVPNVYVQSGTPPSPAAGDLWFW